MNWLENVENWKKVEINMENWLEHLNIWLKMTSIHCQITKIDG